MTEMLPRKFDRGAESQRFLFRNETFQKELETISVEQFCNKIKGAEKGRTEKDRQLRGVKASEKKN